MVGKGKHPVQHQSFHLINYMNAQHCGSEPEQVHVHNMEQLHAHDCHQNVTGPQGSGH